MLKKGHLSSRHPVVVVWGSGMGGCCIGAVIIGGGSLSLPASCCVTMLCDPVMAPFPVQWLSSLFTCLWVAYTLMESSHVVNRGGVLLGPVGLQSVVVWTSSCQCQSPAVCWFQAVWVDCRGVCCGLCLDTGEGAGAGAG